MPKQPRDDVPEHVGKAPPTSVPIPPRLVPIIDEIAKRQHTTRAVIVAQALSDYCHRGL